MLICEVCAVIDVSNAALQRYVNPDETLTERSITSFV
jgi:hypothetical protein